MMPWERANRAADLVARNTHGSHRDYVNWAGSFLAEHAGQEFTIGDLVGHASSVMGYGPGRWARRAQYKLSMILGKMRKCGLVRGRYPRDGGDTRWSWIQREGAG